MVKQYFEFEIVFIIYKIFFTTTLYLIILLQLIVWLI